VREQRPVYVTLSCNHELMPESKVEILDIEEDILGQDLLTFKCPECGEAHKAYRIAPR
jgi:predicted RNA-binding Zn-ribbon protein involved in translation (DUF1610 family)